MLGFLFLLISFQAFGQNTSTFDYLPPHRRVERAFSISQRAILAYPLFRTIRKNIETRFISMAGREFSSTLGAFYLIFERKEISTRYFNIRTPLMGGSLRPDLRYNFETNNAYGGIFFIGEFP